MPKIKLPVYIERVGENKFNAFMHIPIMFGAEHATVYAYGTSVEMARKNCRDQFIQFITTHKLSVVQEEIEIPNIGEQADEKPKRRRTRRSTD